MKKTLIFYKTEYADLAIKLRDNYRAYDHEGADIVSVEEHDDIEYAKELQYDEAVFIEDSDTVTFHDIKSGYTNRLPVSDLFYNDSKHATGWQIPILKTDQGSSLPANTSAAGSRL